MLSTVGWRVQRAVQGVYLELLSGTYKIPRKYVVRKLNVFKNGLQFY